MKGDAPLKGKIFVLKIFPKLMTSFILGFHTIFVTEKLVHFLSPKALNAVLAHERGHSNSYHAFYVSSILFVGLFPIYYVSFPLAVLFYAFYVRTIFGFYSRLFERQADLYGMEIGLPLDDMIEALQRIGFYTKSLYRPSWHHYSLQERIDFLKSVKANPLLATIHNARVNFWKKLFLTLL